MNVSTAEPFHRLVSYIVSLANDEFWRVKEQPLRAAGLGAASWQH
jgi:hypothetical protein